jgi:hypothetical protein
VPSAWSATSRYESRTFHTSQLPSPGGGERALNPQTNRHHLCPWQAIDKDSLPPPEDWQLYRWGFQIVQGLLALQEADIFYSRLALRHILLSHELNGDVRLTGFDVLATDLLQDER